MNRTQFGHSRLLITYRDGKEAAVCSLHCAALDLALNIGRKFQKAGVGDYGTRELIDADGAHWVLGGKKPGVMSRRGKWAFRTKEAAERFVREEGGELVDFNRVLKAAYEDLYEDVQMLRKRQSTHK